MWCVRLLHELCSPASDLSVGFHPIITGTTETEGLRLLQCHALSIDNDVSGQQSASSFRIISSKNLVLFFDCPTLKTEVLRISEASVAIYQPTQRHTAQDVNIYERTPLREIHISLNLQLLSETCPYRHPTQQADNVWYGAYLTAIRYTEMKSVICDWQLLSIFKYMFLLTGILTMLLLYQLLRIEKTFQLIT